MWASTAVRERVRAKSVNFMIANDCGYRARLGYEVRKSVVCFVGKMMLPEGSVKDALGKERWSRNTSRTRRMACGKEE